MPGGVERTNKTTPAFIRFNYTEETSKLDKKMSKFEIFHLTGEYSL